jgi:hypothetical protein
VCRRFVVGIFAGVVEFREIFADCGMTRECRLHFVFAAR